MSRASTAPADIVSVYRETLRALQVLLHEFSSERDVRRRELTALHQEATRLRAEVASLREQIASLHRELMRAAGDVRRLAVLE